MTTIWKACKKKIFPLCYIIIVSILYPACNGKESGKKVKEIPSLNQIIEAANGLSITEKNGYSEVTIKNPWQGAEHISMTYYLSRKGSVLPDNLDSEKVIYVPVSSIVCMSTTHLGMISALGEMNSIKGLSGAGFVYSPEIVSLINDRKISEVGYETSLNQELIIKIAPDLVMMYGIGSESAGHVSKLRELGIQTIFNAEYLETDPLAKAEWIKLFGALYCKEELADSIYRAEVTEYQKLTDYIIQNTSPDEKPVVLLGLPFKDTWFISPGNSFVSKLIADAGGDYLWKNTSSSTSMPYGLENVYVSAMKADYWLNIGTVNRSEEISMVDNRLADLRCFRSKNLYNNNRRINPKGGNDYWESGALYPHLILKDISSILHPSLFPDHDLFYYKKIN